MRVLASRVALAALLLLPACASISEQPSESVTVARRPWFGICAGVCADYDVTVWNDGRVVSIRHNVDEPDEVERFRVSHAEAAEFRTKLHPYRPVGDAPVPEFCEHPLRSDEASLLMKVAEIEIRWSDRRPNRIVACDTKVNAKLVEDIKQALWSVHLYLTGNRRDRSY